MTTRTAARAAAKPAARKPAAKPKPVAKTPDLFREALARVLLHEGGKVNDPHDPGGRTNKGITQRVYSAWRARNSLPVRDVFLIDDMEVEAIYRMQYWQAVHGDVLPRGVGYVVFDGAVNSGVTQSIKWLQRALGPAAGGVDGQIGNMTLHAVEADEDNDALIGRICDRRMVFLEALKTWAYYSKGWTLRVKDVRATGQAWATGSVAPAAEFRPGGEAKAEIEDAKSAPPRAPGDLATGGGGSVAIGTGFLEQARTQLAPYAGAFHIVSVIVVWLLVIGLLVAGGGLIYRWWAARERAKLNAALDLAAAK